jgi:mRNA-degrading endonuclease RelE of RelBE toxin-antitoxin system
LQDAVRHLAVLRIEHRHDFRPVKKSKRPLVLTVNGKAEAVVQDAEAYQKLLDTAARADIYEAIRQGVEDVARRRTRPARDVFNEVRSRHGVLYGSRRDIYRVIFDIDDPRKRVRVLTIRHGAMERFSRT